MNKLQYTILSMLLLFISCDGNKKVANNTSDFQRLINESEHEYFEYLTDIINIRYIENGPVEERWFYKNNEWYSCEDSSLQMSLKDTMAIYNNPFNVKLKTVVKEINDNEYVCAHYDISLEECERQYPTASTRGTHITSIFYYDKNYRIKRIIYPTMKIYTFRDSEKPN